MLQDLDTATLDTATSCGQLILAGFDGSVLPDSIARALADRHRAGVVLFKRNIGDTEQLIQLNRSIIAAAGDWPIFVAVDQEGGRVARVGPPFLQLPPMRRLGEIDDVALTRDVGEQLGRELAAVGFNLDFAPVMDVDSNPDNPVIGDRAFGRDPRSVAKHGVAMIRGLQESLLACAKHFPGHGDTSVDSHIALPTVDQSRERLERLELPPFRAAAGAGVAAMMTAHVMYPSLDANAPATFSHAIATTLLRRTIGFEGVLFTDDLEMGAVAGRSIEQAVVDAVVAGCDVLLLCRDEDKQARAHAALVARCEADELFSARVRVAAQRSLRLRRLCPPAVAGDDVIGRELRSPQAAALMARLFEGSARGDA